jgi:predicted  nucleic acid-binding Zn-ribbon protein
MRDMRPVPAGAEDHGAMSEREIPYGELRERMEHAYIQVEINNVEIERLNKECSALQKRYDTLWREREATKDAHAHLKKLITKLVSELEPRLRFSELEDLIKRAREATR